MPLSSTLPDGLLSKVCATRGMLKRREGEQGVVGAWVLFGLPPNLNFNAPSPHNVSLILSLVRTPLSESIPDPSHPELRCRSHNRARNGT